MLANMGNFRGWEWIIILALALLLFGGFKKMPDAARGLGRSLRIFKSETKGLVEDDEQPKDSNGAPVPPPPAAVEAAPAAPAAPPAPPQAQAPVQPAPPAPPAASVAPPAPPASFTAPAPPAPLSAPTASADSANAGPAA